VSEKNDKNSNYNNKQRNKMKKRFFPLMLMVLASFVFAINSAYAQDSDKDIVVIKSKDVVKTRNSSAHIKVKAPVDDASPVDAPGLKGGKTSGNEVILNFDNYTGFFVEVYVDGAYKGTVGAWGKLTVFNQEACNKIYCVTTGGSKDWLQKGKYKSSHTFKLE